MCGVRERWRPIAIWETVGAAVDEEEEGEEERKASGAWWS